MRRAAFRIRCPKCSAGLNGGPVHYTCDNGHGANAADLYVDYYASFRSTS